MDPKTRIVFLVGGYFPTFTPPGICAEKIIAQLKDRCDITVVCWRRSMEVRDREFDHEGVHVVQVSDFLNDRLVAARTGMGRRFWRMVRLGLSALRLNDSLAWVRRALFRELVRIHRDAPISAMVSVAFPLQTHEAAAAFKIRHPEVRWITYSTDTHHGKTDGRRWLRPFRERSERNCYAKADANFLSREIYTSCADFLGASIMSKSKMLDYMVDLRTASDGDAKPTRIFPEDEIALVFGGAFVEGVRSPEYMLELLERLPSESRVRWHVYSNQGFRPMLEAFASRHPNRLALHPPVGIDEFRRIMRGADILVNVSNDSDQFFPSKAFEYVATGRPIVDIAYPRRAKNEIFLRHPRCLRLVNDGDPDAASRRLDDFCNQETGSLILPEDLAELYAEYCPETALVPLFEELFLFSATPGNSMIHADMTGCGA